MTTRRYSAFISYRHADNTQEGRRWAEWLHRGLERYVVPPDLIGTPNLREEPVRDSLYPIFRDEDELPANADLATGIRAALEVSDHLIVLCSPRSAASPWVRKEVREFKELGRSDRILAIIIAGEPNADDPAKAREGITRDEECFCEELRFGSMREDGRLDWTVRTEPLAADLRPIGTRAEGFVTAEAYREYLTLNSSHAPEKIATLTEAYRQRLDQSLLKVIAGLLGVPLGQLIDRDAVHRADLAKKELARSQAEAARLRTFSHRLAIAGTAALALALLAGVFWWRALESDVKQEALLLTASYGDHEAALRAFSDNRPSEGLAYLERALSYAPKNSAALAASASYTFGGSAKSWRIRSASVFEAGVDCIAFSPDGCYFAAGSYDKTARVVETATGKEVSRIEFGGGVTSVSFSPDGRYLAAGSSDNTARVIEAASGEEVSKAVFGGRVNSVGFSPDGRHFAAGSADKTARVFEAATGKEVSHAHAGFGGEVHSVSFSPDGRYFVAGSEDETARVVEAATGKEVSRAKFGDDVYSVSFSPDGRYLVAGSWDKTARVVEVDTGKEVRACY